MGRKKREILGFVCDTIESKNFTYVNTKGEFKVSMLFFVSDFDFIFVFNIENSLFFKYTGGVDTCNFGGRRIIEWRKKITFERD